MIDALAKVSGKIIRQRHSRSFTSVVIHSDNPALKLRSSFTILINPLHYNFYMYNVCFFLLPRKEVRKASGGKLTIRELTEMMLFLTLDVSNLNDRT